MHLIDPFLFWSSTSLITIATALIFRRLARLVDQQTDALIEKLGPKPIDPKYRFALPMMVVGMLIVLVVVWAAASAVVLWGPELLWKLAGAVSLFRAFRYLGVAGALECGVIAGTMAFPSLCNAIGGEEFRWAYLRSNFIVRHGKQLAGSVWYRASLSTFYVIGALLLLWVSMADYVRVEPGILCRHRFDWIGEFCVPYSELESVTVEKRRGLFGDHEEVLFVVVRDEKWVVATTGLGSTREEIDQLLTRISLQPSP